MRDMRLLSVDTIINKRGNVISFKQTSENEYEGKVSGSVKKPYDVHIDIIHIKKIIL